MVSTAAMKNVRFLIVRVVGMPWPKTGATHYHALLGLPEKNTNTRNTSRPFYFQLIQNKVKGF